MNGLIKKIILIGFLGQSILSFSHDGGHGPKVTDIGKHGGKLTAVVLKSEIELGPKAKLIHKAELVRVKSKSGKKGFRVYIYDEKMKPLPLKTFNKEAGAVVAYYDKNKNDVLKPFKMKLVKNSKYYLSLEVPKAEVKQFYLDVTINDGKRELLAAFTEVEL